MALTKSERRIRIKRRIKKVILGSSERPRMSVYRSNKQISVQLIDDLNGITLLSMSSLNKDVVAKVQNVSGVAQAAVVGEEIGKNAIAKGITSVVFDRNGYLYHGRVKSLAEAARNAGLKF
ncbi:MAG: 50S ribosomal protein L18 [Bacteroidales bacterium]|nr:50S ribosomal protein L18 [Bacteroidales bacterium]